MRTKLLLVCAGLLLTGVTARAQKKDLGRIPARTVTLVSYFRQKDYGKSVFNFERGVRGDAEQGHRQAGKQVRPPRFEEPPNVRSLSDVVNSELTANQTSLTVSGGNAYDLSRVRRSDAAAPDNRRYDYDIRYGAIAFNGDDRWLGVVRVRDSRSVLKDLGEMSWSEVTSVPPLPASPTPYAGVIRFTARGVVAPQGIIARAVVGHMYVLHVKEEWADYYAMFRVESFGPAGECNLSWKRVPSPER